MNEIILGVGIGIFATLFVEMAVLIGWSFATYKGREKRENTN